MNTAKLKEALLELRHQRALLDAAIANLDGILRTLNDAGGVEVSTGKLKAASRADGSYIDLAVRVLEETAKPMHIKEIAARISALRGQEIPRASVESSVIRHIKSQGHNARIAKVSPAIFGLPIWKGLFAKNQESSAA